MLIVRRRDLQLHAVLSAAKVVEMSPRLVVQFPGGFRFHHQMATDHASLIVDAANEALGAPWVKSFRSLEPGLAFECGSSELQKVVDELGKR